MNNKLIKEIFVLGAIGGLLAYNGKARRNKLLTLGLLGLATSYLFNRKSETSFRGHSCVITGGSRGLGLAIAHELASEGAMLTLLARDQEELDEAKRRILSDYPDTQILTIACDVTKESDLESALSQAAQSFQGIDLLVNNAGAIFVGPFEDMTRADYEAQLEIHLFAVMNAVNHSLPFLKSGSGRRIVNICSMGGRVAVPHMLPYDVSKFALSGYSQGLMSELAPDRVSVTTVYPALMNTGSPKQAFFKGDQEKEFAWFATAASFPGLSASPRQIARQVLQSAWERQSELMPSGLAKFRMIIASLFPETVALAMKGLASILPKGHSQILQKGEDSKEIFNSSPLTQISRERAEAAEIEFNQNLKH